MRCSEERLIGTLKKTAGVENARGETAAVENSGGRIAES